MGLYTLYPCRPNGLSDSFVSRELADDTTAFLLAHDVLTDHHSASHVRVYEGERLVGAFPRLAPFAARAMVGAA